MDYFKRKHQITINMAVIIFAYATLLAVFIGGFERKMCFMAMLFMCWSDKFIYRYAKIHTDRSFINGTIIFIISQLILAFCIGRQIVCNENYPVMESGAYLTFRSIVYIASCMIVVFIFEENSAGKNNNWLYLLATINICITLLFFMLLWRLNVIDSSKRNIVLIIAAGMMCVSNLVYNYNRVCIASKWLHEVEKGTKWLYPLALILIVTFIG